MLLEERVPKIPQTSLIMKKLSALRIKISTFMSSFLSIFGLAGTTGSTVCQTTCVATSGVIPLIGVSLAATPLVLLWRYHEAIWIIGLFIFFLAFLNYMLVKKNSGFTDNLLLFINLGILLVAFPFFKGKFFSETISLAGIIFIFIGLMAGLVYIVNGKKFSRGLSLL